jgi:hypothetical protein
MMTVRVSIPISVTAIFLACLLSSTAATAQETTYTDSWNDDIEEGGDLPMHGVGVTEEASGYSPEQVETTMYGHSGEVLSSTQSSVEFYFVQTFVFGRIRWDVEGDAPANCSETRHYRYLLDWGMELIAETLSDIQTRRVESRWIYNKQLAGGDYEYIRSGANCNHSCENERQCSGIKGNWLRGYGWNLGGTVCAMKKMVQSTQPGCKGLWGFPVISTTDCSV